MSPGSRPTNVLLTFCAQDMTNLAAFVPGTLERTPLIYSLVSLLERQSSGTLVLETPDGAKSALSVTHGIPTKMKLAEPVARLGALLAESGYLDESTKESTYQNAARAKKLHGEYLVDSGTLEEGVLARALRSQLLRKLHWASELPVATAFGFYENHDFLARWAGDGIRISPCVVIWQLIRTSRELPAMAEFIRRIESQVLTVHPRAAFGPFGFDLAELALVNALKQRPQTLKELEQLNVVSATTLHRIAYVLKLTRHLVTPSGTEPMGIGLSLDDCVEVLAPRLAHLSPSIAQQATPDPRPIRSDTPQTADVPAEIAAVADYSDEVLGRRLSISNLADECDRLDYYELLGVARDATSAQIQVAFFDLAKRYHPDRLGTEFADLRATGAKLFARIMEAHQTLSDAKLRLGYDAKMGRSDEIADEEQQRIHEIVNAATSFQKAEVLFKKRMLAAAEIEARRAHESDPEQADYLALLAWINANKPNSAECLPKILIQLNTAVNMSPENEKARFYRGQVLSRLGRNLEAVNDYKFVVSKNPRNIDALREIRIWEMRHKAQPAGPSLRDTGGRTTQPGSAASMRSNRTVQSIRPTPTPAQGQPHKNSPSPKSSMLSRLFKR